MFLRSLSVFVFLFVCTSLSAQWLNTGFTFQGHPRQYRVYVPAIYSSSSPVPMVVALHGLGGTMYSISSTAMNLVADTANFILVIPQALTDPNYPTFGNAWNSGAGAANIYLNANINDVAFLQALMDTVSKNYNIDQSRLYVCGFSNGGFMTQRLACELNWKLTAVASLAGTLGSSASIDCNNVAPIPVAHFHGTADGTVGYSNNVFGINVDSLMRFWIAKNNCDTPATHVFMPNLANDSMTVEHFIYYNSQNISMLELFKVNNAGHIWLHKPMNDISYSNEIWKFFLRYQRNNVAVKQIKQFKLRLYPNPASQYLTVVLPEIIASSFQLKVYDLLGRLVINKNISNGSQQFTLNITNQTFKNGIYTMVIQHGQHVLSQKFVINK